MSIRDAEAALGLLLDRLMSVHPEVYGGGRVLQVKKRGVALQVELSRKPPRHAGLPERFMGIDVDYKITGWEPGGVVPYPSCGFR